MAGIDWRALLVKVQQYFIYFAPFFLIGLVLEGVVDSVLNRWLRGKRVAQAWVAAWDSSMFGGKGEPGRQPWWYHALLALRAVAGPLALILAWRWSGSLLWLRLVGGVLLAVALYLALRYTRRLLPERRANPPAAEITVAAPEPSPAGSTPAQASRRAAIAAGELAEPRPVQAATSAALVVNPPVSPLRRWWRSLDAFLGRTLGHRLDWLGLKAAIVLLAGGFIALILPYRTGADFFGGVLPILLLPLAGYFLPTSGGAEMAVVIVLGSKGLSLGAAIAFILASPLLYRTRLEEVELLNGRRAMLAYGLVAWLLPVALGLALYFLLPDKLLLKRVSVAAISCNCKGGRVDSAPIIYYNQFVE